METQQYGRLPGSKMRELESDDWENTATIVWPASARPLSDIRELTEPSLLDAMVRKPAERRNRSNASRQSSLKRGPSLRRAGSVRIVEPTVDSHQKYEADDSEPEDDSPTSIRDTSSLYSIPYSSIPRRVSSQSRDASKTMHSTTMRVSPTPMQKARDNTIPNRGQSRSPVKQAGVRLDPVSSQSSRRVPSRTFIRNPQQRDILEFPTYRHPRIGIDLQVAAPLFVGGGSIEGYIRVVIDDAEKIRQKKNLTIGRLAVDLVGVEETANSRKSIFLSLGTELIDVDHPPPKNMLDPENRNPDSDSFWTLMPSFTSLPFMISLPLDTGPPPFHSKNAHIRFILCTTLFIKDSGRLFPVRCSQEVVVLSTYDPEKALRSLPSPLTACDEFSSAKSGVMESTKVTAGLHRQVWVSGSTIFVDIHISNNSRKTIKKLDFSLERDLLRYRHAAAATLEQSASQARIFESNDRTILSKSCLKQGAQGWTGVEAYGSVTRTCDLDIPRGHATVKCGKYFEVRYFLNIHVSTSHTKLVSVQLPIILIHMNSLDVVPNSVAQVAAAIEEKRSHHHRGRSRNTTDHTGKSHSGRHHQTELAPSPAKATSNLRHHTSKIQGRAFAAPRQQSLERTRAEAAELRKLGAMVESSPRKHMETRSLSQRGEKRTGPSKLRTASGAAGATIVSRPAREIHKQPSSLSLGGISVGSYTIFGDSSVSGSPSGMEYVTPPTKRRGRIFDLSALGSLADDENDREGSLKDRTGRMRSTRSAGSVRSRKSSFTGKTRWRDHFHGSKKEQGPATSRNVHSSQDHRSGVASPEGLGAHSLGLTSHFGSRLQSQPPQTQSTMRRPSRDGADGPGPTRMPSWRAKDEEQLDKGRFEFKAVGKKSSGGFKEWIGVLKGRQEDRKKAVWL